MKDLKDPVKRFEYFEKLKVEEDRLKYEQANVLRAAGWHLTSSSPDCYCMWEREVTYPCWGKTSPNHTEPVMVTRFFLVNQETAIRIQMSLDASFLPPPDDD